MESILTSAKRFAGIPLAFTFLFTGVASAADYVNCSGCNELQMANAALAHGVGRVLVGNLPDDNLIAFRVYQASRPEAITPRPLGASPSSTIVRRGHLYYDWDNLSAEESSAFGAYHDLFVAAGSTSIIIDVSLTLSEAASVGPSRAYLLDAAAPKLNPADVSSDGNIDAFDVVSTPVYRDRVASQIYELAFAGFSNTPNKVHLALVQMLNLVGIGKIISSPLTVIVTVHFANRTQSSFQWNSVTNSWTYVPGSSKDLTGNPIPETAAAAAGWPNATEQNYLFPDNIYGRTDGFSQADNLRRLGIPIEVPVGVYSSAWGIACVTSGSGKGSSTTCHSYLRSK